MEAWGGTETRPLTAWPKVEEEPEIWGEVRAKEGYWMVEVPLASEVVERCVKDLNTCQYTVE